MIAIDSNILVHAHRADSPFHERSAALIKGLAEAPAPWAIPWPCVHEFLAIVTHPRIWDPPTPLERAIDQVDAWLESPSVALLTEGEPHWSRLRELVLSGRAEGPLIHDARVASICLSHGVRELLTADRDFTRFPALRASNPLVG